MLAEKVGIEIEYSPVLAGARTEKDKIREVLEKATQFFRNQLLGSDQARTYLSSRGINEESQKLWRLGYAPAEWRALYNHLSQFGYSKDMLMKAGLIKSVEGGIKEPYDVFRDRLVFPLSDASGQVIAFSGRALATETQPKYLNSPDTILFTKSEVLYGLDLAKEKIRRKNYAVLVEGQMDLVLSHQAGVDNTVASSGTAFTNAHLERLKRLSARIILAFDGDSAGDKAAEKATELALFMGLEVKVAKLPEGKDPADVAKAKPEDWKEILRSALPAIEHFLEKIILSEKDKRKAGKLIGDKILPLMTLLQSSIERSHFVSLIAKRTGIKEEIIWDDLKRVKKSDLTRKTTEVFSVENLTGSPADAVRDGLSPQNLASKREKIEERLTEVRLWVKELTKNSPEANDLKKEEVELEGHLSKELLGQELSELSLALAVAETSKDSEEASKLTKRIHGVLKKIQVLEDKKVL